MRFLSCVLAAVLGSALAQTAPAPATAPAALDGDWQLTSLSERGPQNLQLLQPSGRIHIEGGRLTGAYACSSFQGSLSRQGSRVHIEAATVPARIRCLIAVRGNLLADLNSAQSVIASQDSLLLFSDSARLTFHRVNPSS